MPLETYCSVCAIPCASLTLYVDGEDNHPVCRDCRSAILSRAENPAKWHAFVLKHGDGLQWFEHLPLPQMALNKLQCK